MKIRSRFLTKLAARVACTAFRLLYRTVKIEYRCAVPGTDAFRPTAEKFLYCIWHDALLGPVFADKHVCMAGLVSQHQDGSYLADAMEMVGVLPVRGSSKRGGAQALRQMMEAVENHHIMITPDGPRGPRNVIKDGIVFLASKTGRAIVPTAFSYERCWTFEGSWTDLFIPKPGTKAWFIAGAPFRVPSDLDRDGIEAYRVQLQARLDAITAEAASLAKGLPAEITQPARKAA
jgi:lysophospholipid acyltransferase (LPLAT)-like uncharacterized protein